MSVLLISIAVISATLIWPVNRWIMHNGGRAEVYGFWFSVTAAFVSGFVAITMGQSLCQPIVWGIGAVIGFAFCTGYCLVIMYCLKIGPFGPTVAINNMGLVWPVVLGALWLKKHPLSGWGIMGVALVILSLVSFGPEVVFPFTLVAPVILVLILQQFLYHEHLDKAGWLACFLGVGGLVSLSLG